MESNVEAPLSPSHCVNFSVHIFNRCIFCVLDLLNLSRLTNIDLEMSIFGLHVDFSVFGYIGEENAQAKRHGQQTFDGAAQRPRSLRLAEAFFAKQVDSAVIRM